jgi:hypothetical protein
MIFSFFVEEFLMVSSRILKCAAVAVVVAGASHASAGVVADFNSGTADGFTQDAGQADISGGLSDATEGQQWFYKSPGAKTTPNGAKDPWTPNKNPASGDGALMLGFGYPGKASNHTAVSMEGTWTWETEHERFYNVGPPAVATAPAGGSANPMEKRADFVIGSNSETGDTNAPTAGIKITFGAGADQGWQIWDQNPGANTLLGSYFCSGGESAGTSCSGDSYRSWHDGSIPTDDDKLKQAHELVISANGGGYEAKYSYGQDAGDLRLQVSSLDVTDAVNSAGGAGFINFQTHDSGVVRWDNITHTGVIPEPSSLILVCLGGLGLLIRRKR